MRIVVKVGGELLSPEKRSEAEALAGDLQSLILGGQRVVLVHGGGPQTTELQKQLGQTPHIVAGRRVTDEAALDAIKMVVAGRLNVDFCSILRSAGVNAVGLHGVSGQVIAAKRRPPTVVKGAGEAPVDFGHVGDVTGVNEGLLGLLIEGGYTPVLACLGSDDDGRPFNINADAVANDLAVAWKADALLLVTGTPGVLREVSDPSSRIPTLTRAEADRAIERGVVAGGMIPKLEESFDAIERGVGRVHILGRLSPGLLLEELETPGAHGTALLQRATVPPAA